MMLACSVGMRWSWKIARLAGVDIFVHVTFVLVIAWAAFGGYAAGGGARAAAVTVVFVLAVFAIVVVHELGHALTARRFGIRTRDITLYPIGGVARLERMPERPLHELLVGLSGPAVNVALALLLYVALALGREGSALPQFSEGSLLERLFWVNVSLAGFNLLPAFPMDGGRVLRALLAMRMDRVRATEIAARLGQGLAVVFGALGLFFNPLLLFIALFVWMGASQEAATAQLRAALEGIPVRRAMITDVRVLSPGDSLRVAVEHVLAGFQQDFPVLEDGRIVGVLARSDLLRALARHGEDAAVESAMRRECMPVEADAPVSSVLERLQESACHTLPVTHHGSLVGVLTMDNLGELVLIEGTLKRRAGATT